MKFGTGINPRHWHLGAWLLAILLLLLALLLSHRSSGAQTGAVRTPARGGEVDTGYIAEIVDSTYTVGPAEFFALDLPTRQPGYNAVHLFGTVTTKGRGKDIIVRLFQAPDYDRWLKQKGGVKAEPFWTSKRSKSLTLDQDLPPGEPIVLLLDNGYSIRTSKQVQCQLQIRYVPAATEIFDTDGVPKVAGPDGGAGAATDTSWNNLPPPRSNTEEELPPPPPPAPEGY